MTAVLEVRTALTPPITRRVVADLGNPADWTTPGECRDSIALCVIDAIQSTRSHYTSVRKVLDRYRSFRRDQGADAARDGVSDLLRSFHRLGGSDGWANSIGNRKPTSTNPGAPLKAAAIVRAAQVLRENGIEYAADLRRSTALPAVEAAWTEIAGQRSGLTWSYVSMLTGVTVPGHDPLVIRYLARALDVAPKDLVPADAHVLLDILADRCEFIRANFEYALWRFESGRQVVRDCAQPSSSPSVSR